MYFVNPLLAIGLLIAGQVGPSGVDQTIGDQSSRGTPPTPQQMAPRLAEIPRCASFSSPNQGEPVKTPTNQADRIADAMRQLEQQFPNIACQEGKTHYQDS